MSDVSDVVPEMGIYNQIDRSGKVLTTDHSSRFNDVRQKGAQGAEDAQTHTSLHQSVALFKPGFMSGHIYFSPCFSSLSYHISRFHGTMMAEPNYVTYSISFSPVVCSASS